MNKGELTGEGMVKEDWKETEWRGEETVELWERSGRRSSRKSERSKTEGEREKDGKRESAQSMRSTSVL